MKGTYERTQNGDVIFVGENEYETNKQIIKDWLNETESGQAFSQLYNFEENRKKLAEQLLFHDLDTSFSNLDWVFKILDDSAQFSTAPTEPLTKRGIPLTEPQKQWKEHREFSESHSMKEVRERQRSDPGFNNFVLKNREREWEQPQDGRLPEGVLKEKAPAVSDYEYDRLTEFARQFNAMSAADARKRFLAAYNPKHEEFKSNFEKCAALRLL